jgi:hypothetical protein
MLLKFDVVGSDDLKFPVTIDGNLTVKELLDKVQENHQHLLSSVGLGGRPDFLLALRYKESHALTPNETVSHILSGGETLIAIWASTIARVAPGRHKSALLKLAQFVVYSNGSFFCTLGIVDSLAINSSHGSADLKVSASKKQRVSEAPKPSVAVSNTLAVAASAPSSGTLLIAKHPSSSESSGSSVTSEASQRQQVPLPSSSAKVDPRAVEMSDSSSESGSSSSSVASSSTSSSESKVSSVSSSASSSSHSDRAKDAVAATPNRVVPAVTPPAPAAKPLVPRPASATAQTARKSGPAKVISAAAPVKPAAAPVKPAAAPVKPAAAPMPSPAAPTEKAILAQISTGVAIPSSALKKRGARGGKNSSANKAKAATST